VSLCPKYVSVVTYRLLFCIYFCIILFIVQVIKLLCYFCCVSVSCNSGSHSLYSGTRKIGEGVQLAVVVGFLTVFCASFSDINASV